MGGFTQPVAHGHADAFGWREGAKDDRTALPVERAQTGVKMLCQLGGIVPAAPGHGHTDAGRRRPADRQHDAYLFPSKSAGGLSKPGFHILRGAFDKDEPGARRVMAQAHTGRRQRLARLGFRGQGRAETFYGAASGFANVVGRDCAGAINHHGTLAGIEDRRFDAMLGGTGIEHGIDAAIEILEHVRGGGGTGVAEEVRAGRGHGYAGLVDELESNRMRGHAHTHQRTAGGNGLGNLWAARKQQRERTRPEGFHQLVGRLGYCGDDSIQHAQVGDVNNHRIPGGALFGGEDALNSRRIERVGAEAIDGFGGQSYQAAVAQNSSRQPQGLLRLGSFKMRGINGQPQSVHASIVASDGAAAPLAVYSLFTMAVETEIKFRVNSLEDLARRLEQAGFQVRTPRAFESNVLYDTPDRQMRARTEILRIRSYAGRWTVTHKRLPDNGPGEDTHKHRVETETEIADGGTLEEIFLSLGLVAAFRYEKWRTEWSDGEGHCVVDETPIGNFAELEGAPAWIDRAAGRLGVERERYITLSYGRLFDLWREEHGASAQDLTFAAVDAAQGAA